MHGALGLAWNGFGDGSLGSLGGVRIGCGGDEKELPALLWSSKALFHLRITVTSQCD